MLSTYEAVPNPPGPFRVYPTTVALNRCKYGLRVIHKESVDQPETKFTFKISKSFDLPRRTKVKIRSFRAMKSTLDLTRVERKFARFQC